jgi:hypothetical protein
LLNPKIYDTAAYNHLIVIGFPSKDPLLQKVWGFTVTMDDAKKSLYSQGWGYLQGDIGWIECDRNPFLHSQKIKSAPEGTILVKISGTSEAGILAALKAFQQGLLGGFVPVGNIIRPQATILDRMPDPAPAPVKLPDSVTLDGKPALLAGWYDLPENEYRAIEEAAGVAPTRMWRYKYLAHGILEQPSIVRWLGSVHRMAFGNAINIIKFPSPDAAKQAVGKMASRDGYKKIPGQQDAWTVPQASSSPEKDEVIDKPYWNITLSSKGSYVILSTLPAEEVFLPMVKNLTF